MGVIGDFQSVAKDVAKAGPSINASGRKDIRRVVGALGDDLQTALDVTIIYLRAGVSTSDAKKLSAHLEGAAPKLLKYYKEFKVCEGLYGLRDEFAQVFNSKRLTLSIKDVWRVPRLINDLAFGERSVLDDLQGMVNELAQHSATLRGVAASGRKRSVDTVHARLRKMIAELEERKTAVRASVRAITDRF